VIAAIDSNAASSNAPPPLQSDSPSARSPHPDPVALAAVTLDALDHLRSILPVHPETLHAHSSSPPSYSSTPPPRHLPMPPYHDPANVSLSLREPQLRNPHLPPSPPPPIHHLSRPLPPPPPLDKRVRRLDVSFTARPPAGSKKKWAAVPNPSIHKNGPLAETPYIAGGERSWDNHTNGIPQLGHGMVGNTYGDALALLASHYCQLPCAPATLCFLCYAHHYSDQPCHLVVPPFSERRSPSVLPPLLEVATSQDTKSTLASRMCPRCRLITHAPVPGGCFPPSQPYTFDL
jgi:hypothetical protein